MRVFLEALKTLTLELVLGRSGQHVNTLDPTLESKFVQAQNLVGSQVKRSKAGAAK